VVFDRKALPAGWAKMREIRSDFEAYGESPGLPPPTLAANGAIR